MYSAISVWKFGDEARARVAVERFRAGVPSLIQTQPGFIQWFLLTAAPDEVIAVSLWQSRVAYEHSQAANAAWAQEHLADLDARVSQRRRGEVAAYHAADAGNVATGGADGA